MSADPRPGAVIARARFRDWDGPRRLGEATGANRKAADHALRGKLAERASYQEAVETGRWQVGHGSRSRGSLLFAQALRRLSDRNRDGAWRSFRGMVMRFEYGDGPMQYGVFHAASGSARGTVVLIHGGFWRGTPEYFDGPTPLAAALVARGWQVWQIEYRQLPNGGGWPATLEDTAAAIDHLGEVASAMGVDTGPVITVGHSAGGHLAVWALSRDDATVELTGAISLAGALNLVLGEKEDIGRGAVVAFLGGSSAEYPSRYAAADPVSRIESRSPVRIVHGSRDDVVPMNQSETYVDAAVRAGQDAAITVLDGDHMAVIDPDHPAFEALLVALHDISEHASGASR